MTKKKGPEKKNQGKGGSMRPLQDKNKSTKLRKYKRKKERSRG